MAAPEEVGQRMPHYHLHDDAAISDALPPPSQDSELVEGMGVVCFVGDRWWQVGSTYSLPLWRTGAVCQPRIIPLASDRWRRVTGSDGTRPAAA